MRIQIGNPANHCRLAGGPPERHNIHAIQRTNVVLPQPGFPSITSLRLLRSASSKGMGSGLPGAPPSFAGAVVVSLMNSVSMAGGGTSWGAVSYTHLRAH